MYELNRTYLLRTAVKLLCRECDSTLEPVTDYFPSGEAKLLCGHRRDAMLAEPELKLAK